MTRVFGFFPADRPDVCACLNENPAMPKGRVAPRSDVPNAAADVSGRQLSPRERPRLPAGESSL